VGRPGKVREDLADWKNEDEVFTDRIRQASDPRGAFDRLEGLVSSHADAARSARAGLPAGGGRGGRLGLVEFTALKA